ncbi:hypothetical protein L7F22_032317 [Adiantum nelumboides]|nr:hypothetical protein [Adiantum nelumboides]
MELLREFGRCYAQLSTTKQATLDVENVELSLQATCSEIPEKLELLLEDQSTEQGLKSQWKDVEGVVSFLVKQQHRLDYMVINSINPTSVTIENEAKSPTTSQKNDDSSMLDELVKVEEIRRIEGVEGGVGGAERDDEATRDVFLLSAVRNQELAWLEC